MNWNDLTVEQHNLEVAQRLRGLAAMAESCDQKVKIRMSARMRWDESGDRFQTNVLSFYEFSEKLTKYVAQRVLALLKDAPEDDEQAKALKEYILSTVEV